MYGIVTGIKIAKNVYNKYKIQLYIATFFQKMHSVTSPLLTHHTSITCVYRTVNVSVRPVAKPKGQDRPCLLFSSIRRIDSQSKGIDSGLSKLERIHTSENVPGGEERRGEDDAHESMNVAVKSLI